MELKELHEEVFKFLLEKRKADPSLRYSLRPFDTADKLRDGYWFLSSIDNDLSISFWDAYSKIIDRKYSISTITFKISTDGECVLYINEPNPNRTDLWNDIARFLDLNAKMSYGKWEKEYEGNDFKKHLDHFLSTERPYLNSVFKLKGVEADYPPISEVDFLTKFENIQSIREKHEEKKMLAFLNCKLFIQELHLENINAFKSLDIRFNKQVTCLVGGNGSGKTTILRTIALGLVGFNTPEMTPNLLAIKEAKSETIYHKRGKIKISYKYDEEPYGYENVFDSMEFGRSLNNAIHGSNRNLIAEEDAFKALIVGFAQQSYADPKISTRRRPNISDLESLILNKPDNRFEEFVRWFQEGLKKDFTEDKAFRVLISKIINVINNCIRKEEGNTSNDIDFVGITNINLTTQNNPQGIPIDKLSQGYRNLLGWVGFFAKRLHEYHLTLIEDGIFSENIDFLQLPAVCLIDEIDTYLHPDWQYSILKGLVESFPNVQFIITSHSPFVLTSVPSDKITIYQLNTEGGQIEVKEMTENLYGADANRATSRISDDRTPKFAKLFSRLQNDIDNDRLEDAKTLLKRLIETEHVDEDLDLDILRAKRLIRTKEILNPIKSKIIQ